MATVDTSIYRMAQPQQTDWSAPLRMAAAGQQLADARQRNKLMDATNQAFSQAYDQGTGQIDRNRLYGLLAQGGQGAAIPNVQQSFAAADRGEQQSKLTDLQTKKTQLDLTAQLLGGVSDPQSWAAARQQAAQYGIPLDGVPEQYDPAYVSRMQTMTGQAQQQLENYYRAQALEVQRLRLEAEANGYSAPIQTSQGFAQVDKKGNIKLLQGPDGKPLMPISLDAGGQGAVAEAKARGTAQGKAQVENEQGFGQAEATATQIMGIIDKAISHPGRQYATGMSSMIPIIAGTDAADFNAVLDQIKGQAFLQAFESLKGGGQITEVEGQKATQAIARLERAQSEEAFVEALQDLRSVVQGGLERARRKVNAPGAAASPAVAPPAVGTVEDGWEYVGGDPASPQSWRKAGG